MTILIRGGTIVNHDHSHRARVLKIAKEIADQRVSRMNRWHGQLDATHAHAPRSSDPYGA
jgi:hypothetical protein